MDAHEMLQYYRMLDVSYGSLETAEKIRNELIILRHDQLQARRHSMVDRLILILITMLAGAPVLYSVLPDDLVASKDIWVSTFIFLAASYAFLGFLRWRAAKSETNVLEGLLDETPHLTEDDPIFLEMQLSTFITRLAIVREILEKSPPENMLENLKSLESYWEMRIESTFETMEDLHAQGKITEERYERLQGWKSTAG